MGKVKTFTNFFLLLVMNLDGKEISKVTVDATPSTSKN